MSEEQKQPKSQNYLTVQLNVPALEHLMQEGGDEFVLKLRQTVMEEFCRRRIKALCSETFQKATEAFVNEELAKQVGVIKKDWNSIKVTLNKEFEDGLRQAAKTAVDAILDQHRKEFLEYTDKAINENYSKITREIDIRINYFLNKKIEQYISDQVIKRFNDMVLQFGSNK